MNEEKKVSAKIPKSWEGKVKKSGNSLFIPIPGHIKKQNAAIIAEGTKFEAEVNFLLPIPSEDEIMTEALPQGFLEIYAKHQTSFKAKGLEYNDLLLYMLEKQVSTINHQDFDNSIKKGKYNREEIQKLKWIDKELRR